MQNLPATKKPRLVSFLLVNGQGLLNPLLGCFAGGPQPQQLEAIKDLT